MAALKKMMTKIMLMMAMTSSDDNNLDDDGDDVDNAVQLTSSPSVGSHKHNFPNPRDANDPTQ